MREESLLRLVIAGPAQMREGRMSHVTGEKIAFRMSQDSSDCTRDLDVNSRGRTRVRGPYKER